MAVEVGGRCEGQYRGDWYSGTVLKISSASDTVTIKWDPPHDQWGPATLPKAQVRRLEMSKYEKELMETIEKQKVAQEALADHPLLQVACMLLSQTL